MERGLEPRTTVLWSIHSLARGVEEAQASGKGVEPTRVGPITEAGLRPLPLRGYGRLGGRPFTPRQRKGSYSTVGVESGLGTVGPMEGRRRWAREGLGKWLTSIGVASCKEGHEAHTEPMKGERRRGLCRRRPVETDLIGGALERSYGFAHAQRSRLLMPVGKGGLRAQVM